LHIRQFAPKIFRHHFILGGSMPRLVIPKHATKGHFAAESIDDQPGDKYNDRLIKYIPAESIAFYTFVDKLLSGYYGLNDKGEPTKTAADWLFATAPITLLLVGMAGTFAYMWTRRLSNQPWAMHAIISTIAFALWAYTLEGSFFAVHQWYHVLLAAFLVPGFTFLAGAFEPKR
jgi:hypothetical protein